MSQHLGFPSCYDAIIVTYDMAYIPKLFNNDQLGGADYYK